MNLILAPTTAWISAITLAKYDEWQAYFEYQ